MNLLAWLQSSVEYGQKLVNSALDGARSGGEEFLHANTPAPLLSESVRRAWKPAVLGTCLGVLASYPVNGHRRRGRALACGLLGGAIGFSAGMVWGSRRLGRSFAAGAFKSINKVRDEHWLEKHPIDYA